MAAILSRGDEVTTQCMIITEASATEPRQAMDKRHID